MDSKIYVAVSFVLLAAQSSTANEKVQTACQPSSYVEFIKCAEKSSSEIAISEQELKSATKLEDAAGQWVNPDLDAERVWKGSQKSETTISLLFNLRLGGKKSALLEEARSEVKRAQATRDLSVNQVRLEVMLALYRLSHLKSEISLEEESIETYSKITNQFQKRAALSPEQDVSLNVFKMALSDHQLRLTKLKADREKYYQALTATTGISRESIDKSLPQRKDKWPELPAANDLESSPQMRQTISELGVARSQKNKADSEAWPDLKVGPTYRVSKDNEESTEYIGVGVSMPLPVFTRNGGKRAYYSQKVIEAELIADQSRKKLTATRSELVNRYTQTVASLKSSLTMKALSDKHTLVERQFFRGLVPSSLVIEAHRQMFDLEERRNSSELEAIESYGQILIIDNKFNEVIL